MNNAEAAPQTLEEATQQIEQLKAECADARAEAERQADSARLASEEMQHFVYAFSHDFRQPLRGVLTSAQLLERQTDIKPRIEDLTSSIIQGAVEMNGLIERLLTYSRVASSLRRSIVPLSAAAQWALMNMGKLVTESGAAIDYGDLPTVDVDDSTMATLFQQLFTNSILYRGADTPSVKVTADEQDSGYLISVSDNGCGIKEQYHEKVFAPFQRLHGSEIPGVGLGLSISRKIVRAHGGRIWVESDGTNGSTVRFTIPN